MKDAGYPGSVVLPMVTATPPLALSGSLVMLPVLEPRSPSNAVNPSLLREPCNGHSSLLEEAQTFAVMPNGRDNAPASLPDSSVIEHHEFRVRGDVSTSTSDQKRQKKQEEEETKRSNAQTQRTNEGSWKPATVSPKSATCASRRRSRAHITSTAFRTAPAVAGADPTQLFSSKDGPPTPLARYCSTMLDCGIKTGDTNTSRNGARAINADVVGPYPSLEPTSPIRHATPPVSPLLRERETRTGKNDPVVTELPVSPRNPTPSRLIPATPRPLDRIPTARDTHNRTPAAGTSHPTHELFRNWKGWNSSFPPSSPLQENSKWSPASLDAHDSFISETSAVSDRRRLDLPCQQEEAADPRDANIAKLTFLCAEQPLCRRGSVRRVSITPGTITTYAWTTTRNAVDNTYYRYNLKNTTASSSFDDIMADQYNALYEESKKAALASPAARRKSIVFVPDMFQPTADGGEAQITINDITQKRETQEQLVNSAAHTTETPRTAPLSTASLMPTPHETLLSSGSLTPTPPSPPTSVLSSSARTIQLVTDDRGGLTLRDAYAELLDRQKLQKPLEIEQDPLLKHLLTFILEQMQANAAHITTTNSKNDFWASEILYGCLCLQVFVKATQNDEVMCHSALIKVLLTLVQLDSHKDVAQGAVHTVLHLCGSSTRLRDAFGRYPGATTIAVDLIASVHYEQRKDISTRDFAYFYQPRLQLIEAFAIDKSVFLHTNVVEALLALWDRCELRTFGKRRCITGEDVTRLLKQLRRKHAGSHIGPFKSRCWGLLRHQQNQGNDNTSKPKNHIARRSLSLTRTPTDHLFYQHQPPTTPEQSYLAAQMAALTFTTSPALSSRESLVDYAGRSTEALAALAEGSQAYCAPLLPSSNRVSHSSESGGSSLSTLSQNGLTDDEKLNRADPTPDVLVLNTLCQLPPPAPPTTEMPHIANASYSYWLCEKERQMGSPLLPHVIKTLYMLTCPQLFTNTDKEALARRLAGAALDCYTHPASVAHLTYIIANVMMPMKKQAISLGIIEVLLELLFLGGPLRGPGISNIVRFAALALAHMCAEYRPNALAVLTPKGIPIILVQVLQRRAEFGDAAAVNGLCALFCNLAYHNEDLKELLGQHGACEALIKALYNLVQRARENEINETSDSPSTVDKNPWIVPEASKQEVALLFRAIGNLALHAENMERFVAADVTGAFIAYLTQTIETYDTTSLRACFMTLSNLVIEKDLAGCFEYVVRPLVQLLKKRPIDEGDDTALYRWAFEAVGTICCYSDMAKEQFYSEHGVELVVFVIKALPDDPPLVLEGIYLLGMAASSPEILPALIRQGLLEYCTSLLNKFADLLTKESTQALLSTVQQPSSSEVTVPPDKLTNKNEGEPPPTSAATPVTKDVELEPAFVKTSVRWIKCIACALRCVQRIAIQPAHGRRCVSCGLLAALLRILNLPSCATIVFTEIYRTLFALLQTQSDALQKPAQEDNSGKPPLILKGPEKVLANSQGFQENKKKSKPTMAAAVAALHQHMSRKNDAPAVSKLHYRQGRQKYWLYSDHTRYNLYAPDVPSAHRLPPGLRAWQLIGLTSEHINTLIQLTRRLLASKRFFKNTVLRRMGLGLIAYFACEKQGLKSLYCVVDPWALESIEAPEEESDYPQGKTATNDVEKSTSRSNKSLISCISPLQRQSGHRRNLHISDDALASMQKLKVTNPASLIALLRKTLEKHGATNRQVFEQALLIFNHLIVCPTTDEERLSILDYDFYILLENLVFRNDFVLEVANSTYVLYEFLMEQGTQLSKDAKRYIAATRRYAFLVDCVYPFNLSGWDAAEFLDGVQSLPNALKAFLRDGGQLFRYLPEVPPKELLERHDRPSSYQDQYSQCTPFFWKASHDLGAIVWSATNPTKGKANSTTGGKSIPALSMAYPFSVPVAWASSIVSGFYSPAASKIMKQLKAPESHCLSIVGPVQPGNTGVLSPFILKAKNTKERNALVQLFSAWRDASLSNFK